MVSVCKFMAITRACNSLFEAHSSLKCLSAGAVDEFWKPVMEEESGGPLGWMFGKKAKKDDFPYVDTLKCDYTSQEVSKLASLSSYNLVEGLKNVGFDIDQVEAGNLETEQQVVQ